MMPNKNNMNPNLAWNIVDYLQIGLILSREEIIHLLTYADETITIQDDHSIVRINGYYYIFPFKRNQNGDVIEFYQPFPYTEK